MTTGIATCGVRSWTALIAGVLFALAAPLGAQGTAQGTQQTAPPPPAQGRILTTPQMPTPTRTGAQLDLTMDQAVQMAVDANLSLKQSRLNVDIAAEGIAGAEGAFKPTLSASASTANSTSLPQLITDLTSGSISTASSSGGASVSQSMPWLGGNYSATWSNNRSTTTRVAPTFNPQLSSNVQFSYTQPLFRGLRTDANRTTLANSLTNKQVADLDIQLQTLELTSAVRQAYLGLKAALAQMDVADQNLKLAQQQLDENKAKVAVGLNAKVDIISSQVQVAQNQAFVISARGQIVFAQDQLRTLILDPARPDYWTVEFNPTDTINIEHREIDVEASVKSALANRLDVQEARRNLEIAHRTTRLDDDLTHPSVNAIGQYSATSSGGTQFNYNGVDTTPTGTTVKNFGSVLNQTFTGAFPSWLVGVSVGYPIGKSTAEANLAQQRLVEQQQTLALQNLELSVAATVRQAARNVETNYQIMQANKAAHDAAQQQYDAENRKKDLGLSDTFTLLQKQLQLTQAAVQDISSQISYNSALLTFDQVMRVR